MAENDQKPFRGGKQGSRDSWFGLEGQEGFSDFRQWWHRIGKFEENNGNDLRNRDEAVTFYKLWVEIGMPRSR